LKGAKQPILSAEGCHTLSENRQIKKKGAKLPLLSAEGCQTQLELPLLSAEGCHTQLELPLLSAEAFLYRAGKSSEDINSRLFLINKGLKRLNYVPCKNMFYLLPGLLQVDDVDTIVLQRK